MLKLLVAIGILLAVAAALYVLSILLKPGEQVRDDPSDDEIFPFIPAMLMTRAEIDFYKTIHRAVGDTAVVFGQVPLSRVIEIKPKTHNWQKWRNKIDRKTVDFVLCHPVTFATMAVVELDDKSHQQARRQQRDEFVDRAIAAANIRLVRIPASTTGWSIEDLRNQLIGV